jgi:hypothetical protein
VSLDIDPERICRSGADEVRYEPYEEVLRGALGTFDAGAGNSVDQAFLLTALLDESRIGCPRLARGMIDDPEADGFIAAALLDPTEAAAAAETAFGGGPYRARIEIAQLEPAYPQELAAIEAAAQAVATCLTGA